MIRPPCPRVIASVCRVSMPLKDILPMPIEMHSFWENTLWTEVAERVLIFHYLRILFATLLIEQVKERHRVVQLL